MSDLTPTSNSFVETIVHTHKDQIGEQHQIDSIEPLKVTTHDQLNITKAEEEIGNVAHSRQLVQFGDSSVSKELNDEPNQKKQSEIEEANNGLLMSSSSTTAQKGASIREQMPKETPNTSTLEMNEPFERNNSQITQLVVANELNSSSRSTQNLINSKAQNANKPEGNKNNIPTQLQKLDLTYNSQDIDNVEPTESGNNEEKNSNDLTITNLDSSLPMKESPLVGENQMQHQNVYLQHTPQSGLNQIEQLNQQIEITTSSQHLLEQSNPHHEIVVSGLLTHPNDDINNQNTYLHQININQTNHQNNQTTEQINQTTEHNKEEEKEDKKEDKNEITKQERNEIIKQERNEITKQLEKEVENEYKKEDKNEFKKEDKKEDKKEITNEERNEEDKNEEENKLLEHKNKLLEDKNEEKSEVKKNKDERELNLSICDYFFVVGLKISSNEPLVIGQNYSPSILYQYPPQKK